MDLSPKITKMAYHKFKHHSDGYAEEDERENLDHSRHSLARHGLRRFSRALPWVSVMNRIFSARSIFEFNWLLKKHAC